MRIKRVHFICVISLIKNIERDVYLCLRPTNIKTYIILMDDINLCVGTDIYT